MSEIKKSNRSCLSSTLVIQSCWWMLAVDHLISQLKYQFVHFFLIICFKVSFSVSHFSRLTARTRIFHSDFISFWLETEMRWDIYEMRWDEIKNFMRWDQMKSDFCEIRWDRIRFLWDEMRQNWNEMKLNCDL